MSFYDEYTTKEEKESYEEMLTVVGSLSNLFSDSDKPYLVSRATENIFCRYLGANNLSRADVTADAKKDGIGIGIKTWIGNNLQKIAEFNRDRRNYAELSDDEMIREIAKLRNDRIDFTLRSQNLKRMYYHCTLRERNRINICECNLDFVDVDNVNSVRRRGGIITFEDTHNYYSFNISKSTLYKRFDDLITYRSLGVNIIEDPYSWLREVIYNNASLESLNQLSLTNSSDENKDSLYVGRCVLPFYSTSRDGSQKFVPGRNNLNMRFAGGRRRDIYEVGIPVPASFWRKYQDFLPKGEPFELHLPNGKLLSVRTCQQNYKALMSNPNSDLGHWIIDDVLQINPEIPITYDMLAKYGIDAIEIKKFKRLDSDKYNYYANFAICGSYEAFMGGNITSLVDDLSD